VSQLINRIEAFLGRAGEPIAKVLLHLIVFVHMIQLDHLAIHNVSISPIAGGENTLPVISPGLIAKEDYILSGAYLAKVLSSLGLRATIIAWRCGQYSDTSRFPCILPLTKYDVLKIV